LTGQAEITEKTHSSKLHGNGNHKKQATLFFMLPFPRATCSRNSASFDRSFEHRKEEISATNNDGGHKALKSAKRKQR
jgi:hypothetical protein